ncbi:WFC6A protein, partial [Pterocles burchelli]|nr:WFC6A protein [Pterocles burchelli]
MKSVAALLLVGMLLLWIELPEGSAWSCPPVRVTCAIPDPPNQCYHGRLCPPHQKCCLSSCGTRCLSPPSLPIT